MALFSLAAARIGVAGVVYDVRIVGKLTPDELPRVDDHFKARRPGYRRFSRVHGVRAGGGVLGGPPRQADEARYFLSGDKLPWWMIGGSIVASNISSHHLVGALGMAYSVGFASIVNEWGAILIGFNALLWIFLPFYLRNGFYTMPEFLEKRFGTAARVAYGGLMLLEYVFVEVPPCFTLGAWRYTPC